MYNYSLKAIVLQRQMILCWIPQQWGRKPSPAMLSWCHACVPPMTDANGHACQACARRFRAQGRVQMEAYTLCFQ